MTDFEEPSWERATGEHRDIWLHVPDEIDKEWGRAFREEYGNGAKRTIIQSDYCLVELIPRSPHRYNPSALKRYKGLNVLDHTSEVQAVIDGRVIGVLMVPDVLDGQMTHPLQYEPHLVLDEVTNSGRPITRHALQQVLVPISDKGELLLYD